MLSRNLNQQIKILIVIAVVSVSLLTAFKGRPEAPKSVMIDKNIADSSVALEASSMPISPFNISSQSALAEELNDETIFYELNKGQRWPIASLTKLMTGTVALEKITNTKEINDLIKEMMLISSNEAAETLAATLGAEKFIAAMNERAQELGMNQTSFFDTTGLSFLNQSTVTDLYKLVNYVVLKHPQIFQWSREKELKIKGKKYVNINQFVGRPDFLGGKTGYTDEANGNLISIFSTSKKPLVIIILGAADQAERFEQTKKLLEWISQYYKL